MHRFQEYFDHVKIAWADKGVQDTYERSNEYQLIDSAAQYVPIYIIIMSHIILKNIKVSFVQVFKLLTKILHYFSLSYRF